MKTVIIEMFAIRRFNLLDGMHRLVTLKWPLQCQSRVKL